MVADPVKLQDQSSGVLPDHYKGPSVRCEYNQENVAGKMEKYIYRCSVDKVCCGGQCCVPVAAAGFPLWLLILILVFCFLLVILLLFIIIYYCCNRRRRNAKYESVSSSQRNVDQAGLNTVVSGTPPKVEIYDKSRSAPTSANNTFVKSSSNSVDSRTARHSNNTRLHHNNQKRQEQVTVLTDIESGTGEESDGPGARSNGKRYSDRRAGAARSGAVGSDRLGAKILPFEPSPMEESFENAPRPIPIHYHDRSELVAGSSSERKPLVVTSRPRAEEQKAHLVYYRSEGKRTESFNEQAEYEDD